MKKEKEICWVCKKEKKPYTAFMKNNVLSFVHYEQAREKGPICERCNNYYGLTGKFKDATDKEMEIAKKAAEFARMVLAWWEKDEPLTPDASKDYRDWAGTHYLKEWARKYLLKEMKK